MTTLTIYGASDDLVEVEIEGEFDEEFSAYGFWRGEVVAPTGEKLAVTAEFGKPDSDWTLSIENTGSWPDWPIHFADRPDREGDPAIVLDVPAGTIVREVGR